jgi:acetoin utilization deacetylase AcuC-like enzyme
MLCGAGWCIFNDLAVAARAAQRDAGVQQVLMLDLDVHQGDGSATIFAGRQQQTAVRHIMQQGLLSSLLLAGSTIYSA